MSRSNIKNLPCSLVVPLDEPDSPLFDEDHDDETQAVMSLQDQTLDSYRRTVHCITPEVRASLNSARGGLCGNRQHTARCIPPALRRQIHGRGK